MGRLNQISDNGQRDQLVPNKIGHTKTATCIQIAVMSAVLNKEPSEPKTNRLKSYIRIE